MEEDIYARIDHLTDACTQLAVALQLHSKKSEIMEIEIADLRERISGMHKVLEMQLDLINNLTEEFYSDG